MINFEMKSSILDKNIKDLESLYPTIKEDLLKSEMFGWHKYASSNKQELISSINKDIKELRMLAKTMIVVGIGGSYLGSVAIDRALNSNFNKEYRLIYLGNNLDSDYFNNVLEYCNKNDFVLNVISKSGTTLEPSIAFEIIKELMIDKYGFDEFKKRTIITTDAHHGILREFVNKNDIKSYIINDDIGGRYSVFTPVGLIPLAFTGLDITKLLAGANQASIDFYSDDINVAFKYGSIRYLEYLAGKKVEALITYKPNLRGLIEWYKQLFAESEGKDKKGLLPIGMIYSTDLHSLGQFVQEGTPLLFETNVLFDNNKDINLASFKDNDDFSYLSKYNLSEVNNIVKDSVIKAHYNSGKVNNYLINNGLLNEYNLAYLMAFMMYSCAYSAMLLKVDPFNQPGVEVYKKEIKKVL
ncbi:MAG: glucose-6-phosphate isomerase [Bacilli bacterium]|jgi:glucose-6-phosphate isomerase|nr:glucose-6-phosphate isomerase [Bacilli bacterium]